MKIYNCFNVRQKNNIKFDPWKCKIFRVVSKVLDFENVPISTYNYRHKDSIFQNFESLLFTKLTDDPYFDPMM